MIVASLQEIWPDFTAQLLRRKGQKDLIFGYRGSRNA
jgi:hypothetical protein